MSMLLNLNRYVHPWFVIPMYGVNISQNVFWFSDWRDHQKILFHIKYVDKERLLRLKQISRRHKVHISNNFLPRKKWAEA